MKVIDITYELNEQTKVYEGDPHFIKDEVFNVEKDGFALSIITMGTHAGTHADAPSHFIAGGKTLLDISLSSFVGNCEVFKIENLDKVVNNQKIILKSSTSSEARLTTQQAKELVEKGVKLIGTDALSIGDDEVHKILLENDCVILESLKLDRVSPGFFLLCALPLKIEADGSPIRACLITGVPEESKTIWGGITGVPEESKTIWGGITGVPEESETLWGEISGVPEESETLWGGLEEEK